MEAVARLAAGVAHEINNPMSFVRANLRHLDQELEAASSKPENFDLEVDPHELQSRHAHPKYAEVLVDMKARLKKERERFAAEPWGVPEKVK